MSLEEEDFALVVVSAGLLRVTGRLARAGRRGRDGDPAPEFADDRGLDDDELVLERFESGTGESA